MSAKATARPRKPWSDADHGTGNYDAIVIGSGMGGMTAASLLAHYGKRVLVLEQHWVPGGFTHAFKRKGYEWDVGVHVIGEVTQRSLMGRLLSVLTRGKLAWESLGPVYDRFDWPDGIGVDFCDSPHATMGQLGELFPSERGAIEKYFKLVKKSSKAMRDYYLSRTLPSMLLSRGAEALVTRNDRAMIRVTTREVLDRLTNDERLKSILCGQWGYYGATPSRSAFGIHALVAKHFKWGGYYPVGGAKQIALHMLQTVADAGGWTRVRADVDEIILRHGRAVGVRLKSGEEIFAPKIISGAGIVSTARRMLPAAERNSAWVRSLEGLTPSPAHVCLYLGLRGDIAAAGATRANRWFYDTWDTERASWDLKREADGRLERADVLYVSFPSLKDPMHDPGPKQRHTGEVVTFVPWEAFSQWKGTSWLKRPEAYETFKDQIRERLLSQLYEHMPELEPLVDHVEVSTPLSTDHFARPISGSIYGLEPTLARYAHPELRPRGRIPGLYYAGCDVGAAGVMGAMLGGMLAALAVAPRESIPLMYQMLGSRAPMAVAA